jgi:hypothetical protein
MMALDDQKLALLKALANERDKSRPLYFLETTEIAKALEITIPEIKKLVHSLFVKELVGTGEIDIYAAYLLPEGYEVPRGMSYENLELVWSGLQREIRGYFF